MIGEKEIFTPNTPIFDKKGRSINPGFARHLFFAYNNKKVRWFHRLKEWDFYQINNDRYVVQLTIGHVFYAQNAALTLIDIQEKTTETISLLRLFKGPSLNLPANEELDHVSSISYRGTSISFEKKGNKRFLEAAGIKDHVPWKFSFVLEEFPQHEALAINTPYATSPYQFYLNYKINSLLTHGFVTIGERKITFDKKNSFGLLDWGRGVWPREEVWYWGNLSAYLPDGRLLGLNLGYGFGDLSNSSENMLFLDGKSYKLGPVKIINDIVGKYNEPFIIRDAEGKIDLIMEPTYDRFTNTNLKIIFMTCHQVHGYFSGKITLPNNETIVLDHLLGFFERSHNKW